MPLPLPTNQFSIPLDKTSPVPVYLRIAEGLGRRIKAGQLSEGLRLPPERVLCEEYSVSRMTLRQAMGILEREGLIHAQRGRGTFVAHGVLRKQQQELRSFTEEIRARGSVPASRVLSLGIKIANPEVQKFFRLDVGEVRVYELCRLRLCDGRPLALETVLLPEFLCLGLDRFNLAKKSLYRILEDKYGLLPDHCREEISAARASSAQRRMLELSSSDAILLVKRWTYSKDGRPMEIASTAYRGDSYAAVVHSQRGRL